MPANMPHHLGVPDRSVAISYALTAQVKRLVDEHGDRGGNTVQLLAVGWYDEPHRSGAVRVAQPPAYLVFDRQEPGGVFWISEDHIERLTHGST